MSEVPLYRAGRLGGGSAVGGSGGSWLRLIFGGLGKWGLPPFPPPLRAPHREPAPRTRKSMSISGQATSLHCQAAGVHSFLCTGCRCALLIMSLLLEHESQCLWRKSIKANQIQCLLPIRSPYRPVGIVFSQSGIVCQSGIVFSLSSVRVPNRCF